MYDYEYSDELYHYGRKGMKWGQHIFGKVKASAGRAIADRRERKRLEKLRKTPISRLTEAELKERISRMKLEKEVSDLMRSTSETDARYISTGKKIISAAANKVLAPALVESGKKLLGQYLDKTGMKALGLVKDEVTDPFKDLSDTVKRVELEAREAEARKKKTLVDDYYKHREQEEKKAKEAEEKAKKEAKETEAQAKREAKEAEKRAKETLDKTNKKPYDYYDPIDAEWSEVPASGLSRSDPTVATGEDFVNRLLIPR